MAGTALASSDSIPDQVVTVNLRNGKLTPFVRHLQTAKGLVYLDAAGTEPLLPLAGQSTPASTATSGGSGSAKHVTSSAIATKASADSDTLSIVLAIVALLLALLTGGYAVSRLRLAAS